MSFSIAVETPLQDDVRALVVELDAFAAAQTPDEFRHSMTVEQMAQPDTAVFVAREAGAALGMGALKRHAAEQLGEVKRMFTRPSARGRGVGRAIVAEIEKLARSEGFSRLVLETGVAETFKSAWRVYETSGFKRCGAFLSYPPISPYNIYYEKLLSA